MGLTKLEDRILFDAGMLGDVVDITNETEASNEADNEPSPEAETQGEENHLAEDSNINEDLEGGTVIIIDEGVENFETLVNGADQDAAVYTIKSGDGIAQLIDILNSHQNIGDVHIISHGNVGEIRLGSSVLNSGNLADNAGALATVADNFTDGADMIFYGCRVAENGLGRSFIDSIAEITGTDIAASSDTTGNILNANWEMEYSTGEIEAEIPFTEESLLQINGALAVLSVGDLVVINLDIDHGEFRLMALNDISSGTVIKITDRGLSSDGTTFATTNGSNEGTITWTLGTAINAGETFKFTITPSGVGGTPGSVSIIEVGDNVNRSAEVAGGILGWETFSFSGTGDQIIVYQEGPLNFISGLSTAFGDANHAVNGDWQSSTNVLSYLSHLPSGLINNTNALAFTGSSAFPTGHSDNIAYNGTVTAADKATWLTRIYNRSNWVGDNTTNQIGSISETAGNAGAAPTVVTNTDPALSISGTTLAYVEDVSGALQIDSAGTVSDADGDAEWNGGTLEAQITANNEAADSISISDTDGDGTAITVIGTNIFANGTDIGNLSVSGGTVTNGTKLTITFDSDATNANVQEVLQSLRYNNSSDAPGTSNRTITITATDTNAGSAVDTRIVSVAGTNDAPTATGIPTDITVTEDTASNVDLSAVAFSDNDGDSLTITLTATAGTFTSSSGAGVTVGGSGTGTLTLAGSTANINTFLDTTTNVKYTGASNVNGGDAATFTIKANDSTVNPTLGTVNLDITAVNDDPTATGVPSDVTVTEDTASNVDFSAISFADVDSASITVTLTASAGTFAAPADGAGIGGGVTETLVSATVITLVGAPADINTYLDTASNIKYTGASNVSGNDAATITVTANDGDGSGNVNLGTVNVDITAVNDAPTATGIPTDITVTEDTASNVDLSAVTFADVDGDSLTVTLTASAGTFTSSSGGGVTIGGSGTGTLTLAGTAANINTFLDTTTNVKYTGASNVNGGDAATFTVKANDGTVNPTLGTVNLDITAVNDDPTATGVPSDVTVTEDTASNVDLSAITFADVDSASITVTLTASAGTFAAPADGAGVGGGVTETLVSATVITLAGAPADINTYLDTASNIQYTGASNVSGNDAATITVTANDGDGSGNVNLGTVNLDITGTNDPPTATGIPTDITVTEDTASNVDLSAVTFADVDGDSLTVTLTASAGTFAAASGGGVTIGGSGTGTLTLAGTAANINTFLDTVTNVQYTSALNATGNDAATFTIQANDATVNPTLGTVNLDITAVNDNPTASGVPSDVTVTEDTASNVDLSAITFADVDSATITVTLTASAGTFATPVDGAGVGGGVTETLVSATVITLVGASSDINTYLDTASNIKYTGASNVSGNDAATITVTANDGDGSGNVNLGTVNVDITGANDAPTATGIPTDITVTEDTASNVNLSAVTFADVDGDSLTVTLTASAGTFAAASGGGVTIGGSGTGTLTLAGTAANINTFLDTVTNVQYTSALNATGNDAATFTIQANDATVNPTLATVNIDITGTNDAPTATGIPTDITVTEDTASNVDLSAVTFADIDGDSLTVTLTASAGTFAAASGGGVTIGGSGTGTLTLAGTAANINTFLDTVTNIQYTSALNATGNDAATFTIQANDATVNPTLATVNLDITGTNDAPTATGIPTDITVTEDTASNVDLSAVTFADIDGDSLTVTLTASAGTFAAASGGGVTIGGSGTGTLTLAGTAANINTFLDTVTNVQYTSALNATGNDAATFTIQANDATVNPTLATVNLDITGTNDAPTATGIPTDITVIENTASNFDLSAVTFTDVDGDALSVTLTATAGTYTAVSGGGVVIGGSGTGTLTLAGTVANINTFLDNAANIQYTGPANVNGDNAATFTIQANDSSVNPTLGTVNVDINIMPVTTDATLQTFLNSDQTSFENPGNGSEEADPDNNLLDFTSSSTESSDFIFGSNDGFQNDDRKAAYMDGENGLSNPFSGFSDDEETFSRLDGLTGDLIKLPTLSFQFERALKEFLK